MKFVPFIFGYWLLSCLVTFGQLTLQSGETFGFYTNWTPSVGGFSTPQSGHVVIYLDSETVQDEDQVLVEIFEGPVGQGLVASNVFSHTNLIVQYGNGFAWWDLDGGFRITMLSGSVTITNIIAEMANGPFNFPAHYYGVEFVPPPRLRMWVDAAQHLSVRWATNTPQYVLEQSLSMAPESWAEVTRERGIVGDQFVLDLNNEEKGSFFRLRKKE